MWYPGRGSFLLGSAVVGVGGGGMVAVCRSYPLLIVTYTTGMSQLRSIYSIFNLRHQVLLIILGFCGPPDGTREPGFDNLLFSLYGYSNRLNNIVLLEKALFLCEHYQHMGRVCSQTQLCQLRCLVTILENYMFRPLLAIFRLFLRERKVLPYNVRADYIVGP